jgi:hypothetical protein
VMGDFDDWTHGLRLSADSQDTVYTEFKGDLPLLPVSWRVPLLSIALFPFHWSKSQMFVLLHGLEGLSC